jgi:hypothetical protein
MLKGDSTPLMKGKLFRFIILGVTNVWFGRIVELSLALDQKVEQLTVVRGVQQEYVSYAYGTMLFMFIRLEITTSDASWKRKMLRLPRSPRLSPRSIKRMYIRSTCEMMSDDVVVRYLDKLFSILFLNKASQKLVSTPENGNQN